MVTATHSRTRKAIPIVQDYDIAADAKNRISLPKSVRSPSSHIYKVFANESGQIVLDPQVVIPASEAWLYNNKKALDSVRQGLAESKAGKLKRKKSLSKHAKDQID